MDKKPVLLAILLALVLVVAYVGFIASVAPVTTEPTAVGQVNLEVTGGTVSATTGEVTLDVTA